MVTNKQWFVDLYGEFTSADASEEDVLALPYTDTYDGIQTPYIYGGYAKDLDSKVHLMGAIKIPEGYKLFWFAEEPENGNTVREYMNQLASTKYASQDPVYDALFANESGWEWDIVGDVLNPDEASRPVSDDTMVFEILPVNATWADVKVHLLEHAGKLARGDS